MKAEPSRLIPRKFPENLERFKLRNNGNAVKEQTP